MKLSFFILLGLVLGLAGHPGEAQVIPLKFQPLQLSNRMAVLSLGGPSQYNALEASTNLTDWFPVATLQTRGGVLQYIDAGAVNAVARFYRAYQVAHQPALLEVNPSTGPVGTQVEILGRFFASSPSGNDLRVGGARAKILQASDSRLLVEVPTNAATGPVTLTTSLGSTAERQLFTVSEEVLLNFQPSPGLSLGDFQLSSSYGAANGIRGIANATHRATVSQGVPTLIVAAPNDTNRQFFFYSIALSGGSIVPVDAASTAAAFVFHQPFFMTSDPVLAAHLLNIIYQNAKVRQFAQVIAQLFARSGNPFTNDLFQTAYSDAVVSVGTGQPVQLLRAELDQARAVPLAETSGTGAEIFPLEYPATRFLELERSGNKFKPEGFPFNPVDWVVLFQEMDVAKTFPNGRIDFDKIVHEVSPKPENYEMVEGWEAEGSVEADLLFSRFDLVGYFSKQLTKSILSGHAEEGIEFPKTDTIYVMRGIGPSFLPPEDYAFVENHFEDHYRQAVAINLISAIIDLASAAMTSEGFKEVAGDGKFVTKLVAEVLKAAPKVNSAKEFVEAAKELAAFFIEQALEHPLEKGEEAFTEGAKTLVNTAAKSVSVPLEIFKAIGGVGMVAERASGIVRTTTLETTLIVVGNPFQLQIVSVNPRGGSLGDDIHLVIQGAAFDPQNPKDQVNFEGPEFFDGKVSAMSDLGQGRQDLLVHIPEDSGAIDGAYTIYVNAEGRRGHTNFTLTSRPIITGMDVTEGFAASADFLGNAYQGTPVTLTGFGFSSSDTFIFNGGAEATDKNDTWGGVILRVPAGAQSGPITVRRRFSASDARQAQSPDFAVLGPPAFLSVTPSSAPVGATVFLKMANTLSGRRDIQLRFGDNELTGAAFLPMGNRFSQTISITVPSWAKDGSSITVVTPAGQVSTAFTVLPGLAPGGNIQVGVGVNDPVNPGVTLDRALAFASGQATPTDDSVFTFNPNTGDVSSVTDNDPPFDEGDFVTDLGPKAPVRFPVGTTFADQISLNTTVTGNFTMAGDFDTIRAGFDGAINGTLAITGNNNSVTLAVRGSVGDGILIRGNNNTVNVRCQDIAGDAVRIEGGKGNTVSITAARIGGNAVALTGGASRNTIWMTSGSVDPQTRLLQPNSGAQKHGVLLSGDVTENTINATASGNAGDGVHLEGPGVIHNRILVGAASFNTGNGVAILGGAVSNEVGEATCENNSGYGVLVAGAGTDGNRIFATVNSNARSGLALLGDAAGGPRRTFINSSSTSNNNYGLLISGIVDAPGATVVSASALGDLIAGIHLENTVSGIAFGDPDHQIIGNLFASGSPVGVEFQGPNITNNVAVITVNQCATGVAITNAQRNVLHLSARQCTNAGVVLSGAISNVLSEVTVEGNQGDGLVLTDAAEANVMPGIHAPQFGSNQNGLVIEGGARNNVIRYPSASGNFQNGVLIQGDGTSGNQIVNPNIDQGAGIVPGIGPFGDGVRIQGGATNNTVFSEVAGISGIRNSAATGVRITGQGTKGNSIKGLSIGALFGGSSQPVGIIVEDNAEDTQIGGTGDQDKNLIQQNQIGVLVRGPVGRVAIVNNIIQSGSTNSQAGIVVDNASGVFIGGDDPSSQNFIATLPLGLRLQGAGTTNCQILGNRFSLNTNAIAIMDGASFNVIGSSNLIDYNQTGVLVNGAARNRIFANMIDNNSGVAVLFVNSASNNVIEGNTIFGNDVGVLAAGLQTVGNTITGNSISANKTKGIVLADGGNREIPPPTLNDLTPMALFGAALAPDQSTAEVFQDPNDEGDTFLVSAPVFDEKFRAAAELTLADVGTRFQLTGTVTDPDGDTSEFGPLRTQLVPPPWKLSVSPGFVPDASGTLTATVRVTRQPGNLDSIKLSLKSAPAGVTATFNPNPIPSSGNSSTNSTLTLVIGSTTARGVFPLTISGTGSPSGYTGKATFVLGTH